MLLVAIANKYICPFFNLLTPYPMPPTPCILPHFRAFALLPSYPLHAVLANFNSKDVIFIDFFEGKG
jgi:hypothetical protein